MKIGIANDHRAVAIKQKTIKFLTDLGYNVVNYGTDSEENIDYCDFAFKIGEEVVNGNIDYGILFCNTGIGMSIAANKVKGVRCAKVNNVYEALMTRKDNDANIIALSSHTDLEEAKKILKTFLETPYENLERYNRRKDKIDNYVN